MAGWITVVARGERGTSVTEYALIIAGVALAMVAVVGTFHETVAGMWARVVELM